MPSVHATSARKSNLQFISGRTLRVTFVLLGASLALTVVSGLLYIATVLASPDARAAAESAWTLVNVDGERNIPTWFSTLLWAGLAGLAFTAGRFSARHRGAWGLFAFVAAFFSLDEFAGFHERLDRLGPRLAELLPFELTFPWVIAAAPIVLVIVAMLARLVFTLPAPARTTLILGGVLLLTAVLVVETLSGAVLAHFDGLRTWHFHLFTHAEEFLEMVGLSLAIGAVLSLFALERQGDGALEVRFTA